MRNKFIAFTITTSAILLFQTIAFGQCNESNLTTKEFRLLDSLINTNKKIRFKQKPFNFEDKKVAFISGHSATDIQEKEKFFKIHIYHYLDEGQKSTIAYRALNEKEKEMSGGYDVLVMSVPKLYSEKQHKTNLQNLAKLEDEKKVINKKVNSTTFKKKDSLAIQNLIRKVYEWNSNNNRTYFNIGQQHKTEYKYTGINWKAYNEIENNLRETGYFTDNFIHNYKNVLSSIDKKVKNGEYEWNQGEYPPFGTGANEWCHCQDNPDEYWKTMIIRTIKLNNNTVDLTWDWGKDIDWNWIEEYKNGYPLSVINENGVWKISYMDGFDEKHY